MRRHNVGARVSIKTAQVACGCLREDALIVAPRTIVMGKGTVEWHPIGVLDVTKCRWGSAGLLTCRELSKGSKTFGKASSKTPMTGSQSACCSPCPWSGRKGRCATQSLRTGRMRTPWSAASSGSGVCPCPARW